jgi:ADP-heptose:LPS heptosyltransferase
MKTFGIVHNGALGDFILCWPCLLGLKTVLPGYHFAGIGRGEYMRLAQRVGLIDSFLDREAHTMRDFFAGKALPSSMTRPDGGVVWLSDGQAAASLLRRQASLPVIAVQPFPLTRTHVARYYYDAVRVSFSLPQSMPEAIPWPPDLRRMHRSDRILIHPGSGSAKKNFSPDLYRRIAAFIRQQKDRRIDFVLGPVEMERGMASAFAGEHIVTPADITTFAEALCDAAFFIGNDSGPGHLAAILGVPTISLYKQTDPGVWGTVGRQTYHLAETGENRVFERVCAILRDGACSGY